MKCTFSDCRQYSFNGGYCNGHLKQWRAGQVLQPLGPKRDTKGRKLCNTCDQWFPVAKYTKVSRSRDGLSASCKNCTLLSSRLNRYKLTVDQLEALEKGQKFKCAICKVSIKEGYSVDHDHACCPNTYTCGKCIRGLLCGPCNTLLGMAKDSIDTLNAAVAYLGSGVLY